MRRLQDDLINEINELQLKDNYDEEKANIYPHIVCLWMELIEKEKFLSRKEKYLEKAYSLLRKERKMYHVTEVLRGIIYCKETRGKKCEREKTAYEAICHLYQFFQKDIFFHPFEISETMWMFTILSEYLKKK